MKKLWHPLVVRFLKTCGTLAILGSLLVLNLPAEDWAQWRGPRRNGHSSEPNSIEVLAAEPKVRWKVKVGEGLSSPVASGGTVFYLDTQDGKEMVQAVRADSGQRLWSAALDDVFKDSQSSPGPRSTPLVDGTRLFAQSCRGELQCLDTRNGTVIWRKNFVSDFGAVFIGEKGSAAGASRHGYNAAPLIHGEHLIALAGGTNGAGVVCLKKASGDLVWKSQNDPAAYAAPIIETVAGVAQFMAFTVDGLIGLNPVDGQLLWRVPLRTTFGRHASTPVVAGDLVLASSHEIGLIGARIAKRGSAIQATVIWTNKQAAINFSSPVVVGPYLYGLGPAQNIICVDVATGKIAWSKEGFFQSAASKAYAAFIVTGPNVLALTDGGELLLFATDPLGFQEKGRAQVCGSNWCNPALVDKALYLRDSRDLFCIDLASQ